MAEIAYLYYLIIMYIPDYDEYYSLHSYADRFISDTDEVIKIFFSKPSTINLITIWEINHNNDTFIKDAASLYHERALKGEELDIKEMCSALNLCSVFVEEGDTIAHIDIYNAFVSFLTENGINT